MSTTRSVSIAELRQLVTDPSELKKGTEVADRGGLAHLARHENKIFADAAGSGPAPYKTQIVFGDDKVTGRCSCMAARSRPFCKHAAALLVSWARTPEAFVVSDAPPAGPADGRARRAAVKGAKIDPTEARKKGVEQALTVLSELWLTGVVAIAADRADQVAELATSLRELGLRRLSVRMLDLGELLRLAAKRDGSFPEETYATLVADMWLTVRKLEKHLAGEPLADEHVEELIGKTWTKKDRKPIDALDLVEYAFLSRTTADDFVLRESRFVELKTGAHFTEKQILPAMIAKRTAPKPSYAGRVLRGTSGSVFPSFAPRRLDVDAKLADEPLDAAVLATVVERALPSVSAALAALAERRRDVFAPPWVPVALRIDWVVPSRSRVRLLDADGATLFLAGGRPQEDALMAALAGMEAEVILGDVALEGAMPCLFPLAVVGKREGARVLWPLGDESATEALDRRGPPAPTDEAKKAGVSAAATMLGEVRADLATAFVEGVSRLDARFVDPIAARLGELSLAKQADALRAAAAAPDPVDRLDGLVKLHQVLGIALTRLVGTAKIDAASLVRLPTMPSVAVPRPAALLAPSEAVSKEASGEIHRYERAYHVGTHYAAMSPETLVKEVDALWGDGFAAPFVVRAAAQHPALAVENAIAALSEGKGAVYYRRCTSRLAKLTALTILGEHGGARGHAFLRSLATEKIDPALVAHVRRVLDGPQMPPETARTHVAMALTGSSKEDRASAIHRLGHAAVVEAIPSIRAALRDRTHDVRRAAAFTLAALGDLASLDLFVSWLEGERHDEAKTGAYALGMLGDVRGAGALLGALARGFSPTIAREALTQLGPWVLGPLLDLTLTQPELAKRASVASIVKAMPHETSVGTLRAWIEAGESAEACVTRALLALETTSARKDIREDLVAFLRTERADLVAHEGPQRKTLEKKLAPPKPPKSPAI